MWEQHRRTHNSYVATFFLRYAITIMSRHLTIASVCCAFWFLASVALATGLGIALSGNGEDASPSKFDISGAGTCIQNGGEITVQDYNYTLWATNPRSVLTTPPLLTYFGKERRRHFFRLGRGRFRMVSPRCGTRLRLPPSSEVSLRKDGARRVRRRLRHGGRERGMRPRGREGRAHERVVRVRPHRRQPQLWSRYGYVRLRRFVRVTSKTFLTYEYTVHHVAPTRRMEEKMKISITVW